ncbi:MAG: VWA domain-containing protein [Phyllobacteriaceae bacterium]|nr:VWA domain-containing protein [Phyllobacteriaceae bacterium]
MSRTGRRLRDLIGQCRGNVAVVFALTVSGMILIGGGGIDLMKMSSNRKYLQERVDATALYVANGLTSSTLGTAQSKAQTKLAAIVEPSHGTLADIATSTTDGTLTLSASLTTRSSFLGLIGLANLVTEASSTVTWGETSLEVALVLDNTGSMADSGKIDALKSAATNMVTTLAAKTTSANSVKFALVPFATFVNVGSGYSTASWIDSTGLSPNHSTYFSTSLNRFTLYTALGKSWPGCVETRPSPYDVDDTPPSVANPSTLFVPSFHPDEPKSTWFYTYANSYLGDVTNSNDEITKLTYAPKYTSLTGKDFSVSTFYSNYQVAKGPGFFCDVKPIVRLTTNTTTINNAINALTVSGSTNIPEGLAWGWRMVSPQGPFSDGQSYSSNTLKIVVLLTDGTNAINTFNTPLGGAYSSWGYPYSNRLGNSPGTNLRDGLDAKTRTVCSAIKAKGIKVYTVGLMIDDTAGQQLLSDCASGTDYYYNSPSAGQLSAVFTSIAQKIIKLRIAR